MGRHGDVITLPNTGTLPSVAKIHLHRIYTFLLLPFVYNLFADFFALIITRRVLSHLYARPAVTIDRLIIMFAISAAVLLALAAVLLDVVTLILDYLTHVSPDEILGERTIRNPQNFLGAIVFPFYRSYSEILGEWSTITVYGVFLWSTLMGIFWLASFSVAIIIANVSIKFRGVGPWLDKNFKVRSQPFQILGFIAIISVSGACVIYHLLF
jgi:hypothetical protein